MNLDKSFKAKALNKNFPPIYVIFVESNICKTLLSPSRSPTALQQRAVKKRRLRSLIDDDNNDFDNLSKAERELKLNDRDVQQIKQGLTFLPEHSFLLKSYGVVVRWGGGGCP